MKTVKNSQQPVTSLILCWFSLRQVRSWIMCWKFHSKNYLESKSKIRRALWNRKFIISNILKLVFQKEQHSVGISVQYFFIMSLIFYFWLTLRLEQLSLISRYLYQYGIGVTENDPFRYLLRGFARVLRKSTKLLNSMTGAVVNYYWFPGYVRINACK